MATRTLRRVLQDWFADQVDAAPRDDPRRTPMCLRFSELAAGPDALPPERAAHAEECEWCRRGRAACLSAQPGATGIAISLGAGARWPAELKDRLAQWLRSVSQVEAAESTPARFDEAGNLVVHWTGLEVEGPVTVSLVWQGVEIPLARGVTRGGVLDIREPMAELGVRSLSVSARLLRVRLEDDG